MFRPKQMVALIKSEYFEATLALLVRHPDSASVRQDRGVPRWNASVVPSFRPWVDRALRHVAACPCQLGPGSARNNLRVELPVALATVEVGLKMP